MIRLARLGCCALALAAWGCKSPDAPTGFGVNLTVTSSGLPDATRASISRAILSVTGDQVVFSQAVDIVAGLQSGQARFRYIPKTHSGTLIFQVDAQNAGQMSVATGTSGNITIVDGQASTAPITLSPTVVVNDLGVHDLAGVDLSGDMAMRPPADLLGKTICTYGGNRYADGCVFGP